MEKIDSVQIRHGKRYDFYILDNNPKIIQISETDQLSIYPNDYVPLQISGLKNIQSDTIRIVGYQLYNYCSNDTITYTHEKKKRFSSKYKSTEDTNIIYCDQTNSTVPQEWTVDINGIAYTTSLVVWQSGEISYSCGNGHSYGEIHNPLYAKYVVVLK